MVPDEMFSPHDSHHYENDDRLARLTLGLLAAFCVALAFLAAVVAQ